MSYVLRATGERRELIVVYGQVRPGLVAVHTVDVTDGPDGGARAEREGWEKLVERAITDGRLLAYSQPIVPLAEDCPPREEFLARMRDEGGNVLGAPAFLPHAERLGLIGAIDRWMIDRAFTAAAGGRCVHVNLSARSLEDPGLVGYVTDCLEASGAEGSRVTFEITETAAVHRLEDAVAVAEGLSALGCELALDDFGTGHAPLSYLAELPVDHVKIDMRFVRGLLTRPRDERVVRSIVRMAGEFGVRTVAEGVEDAETLERLRELGVDYAQGYHLGRPAPSSPA
jgi:EAL domain-containing protein (putative c-di-GMP-specific phosphodiesterase class I)